MATPEHPQPVPETASPEVAGESISLGDFLKSVVSELDANPDLSLKEKQIVKRILNKVAEQSGVDKKTTEQLKITHKTAAELAELKEQVKSKVAMRTVDRGKFTETDVEDIADFLKTMLDAESVSREGTRTDIRDDQEDPEQATRRTIVKGEMDRIANEKGIEGVKDVADLRELPVEVLMRLEDEHEGILLYAFTDFVDGGKQIDLASFESFYRNPVAGTTLKVNFRGNAAAESEVGAAELMPPSIRRITVYDQGNPELARTSTKRVGLKGRGQRGNGFFDGEGYIPIYSTDEVIVGGVQSASKAGEKPDTGIDPEFEKKYRDAAGKLDYTKYAADHDKAEATFIRSLEKRHARVGKVYTSEELDAVEEKIETSGVRKRIVSAAMRLLKKGTSGSSCWNWVEKVYQAAGADRGAVTYRHPKYKRRTFDKKNPGKHENPHQVETIEPGDWVFIYNQNGIDKYNDHSVLFLRWENKAQHTAVVANCTGAGKAGSLRTIDFDKTPLTMLIKPKA